MLVGQPQLGFSITSPFKTVAKGIYQAHVIGTKALIRVAKDPRAQRAAAAAAQSYAPEKYAAATEYADRARGIIRPPGPMAPMPSPEMMPPGQDDGAADDAAPMPAGGRVQKGNLMTIALIGGAAVLLIVMLKK